MGLIINIGLFLLVFLILAISGGFATSSARRVTKLPGYKTNSSLDTAHKRLTTAAVITWIVIPLYIVIIVLYAIFAEFDFFLVGIFSLLFLGSAMLFIFIIGILSAVGAYDIGASGVPSTNDARRDAIIASVLALISFAGVIGLFIYRHYKKHHKSKIKKSKTTG